MVFQSFPQVGPCASLRLWVQLQNIRCSVCFHQKLKLALAMSLSSAVSKLYKLEHMELSNLPWDLQKSQTSCILHCSHSFTHHYQKFRKWSHVRRLKSSAIPGMFLSPPLVLKPTTFTIKRRGWIHNKEPSVHGFHFSPSSKETRNTNKCEAWELSARWRYRDAAFPSLLLDSYWRLQFYQNKSAPMPWCETDQNAVLLALCELRLFLGVEKHSRSNFMVWSPRLNDT